MNQASLKRRRSSGRLTGLAPTLPQYKAHFFAMPG